MSGAVKYQEVGGTRHVVPIIDNPARLDWMLEGLCGQSDPEAWFPEKGGSTKDCKRVCNRCPVRELCLDYALEHDIRFGVWGGLSERERRRVSKGQLDGAA